MSNKNKHKSGIVYSTETAFSFLVDNETTDTLPNREQNLKVHLEKNHRGGKTVSIIRDFVGTDDDLTTLSSTLKKLCGTGGSAKDGEVLIQGDFRDKILTYLIKEGYKAKKAGG